MRNRFDEQLAQLNHEMIEMGALCEEVIALASKALTESDRTLAKKVAPVDSEIDRKERAEDIAEIIAFLEDRQAENDAVFREMARAVIQMVTESVDAYVKCDIILAKKVIADDDYVDDCFARIKQSLISRIAAAPTEGEYALDLLMIAKYYERIGDHATNIAEWVIYSVTGVHKDEITLT